MFKNNGKLKLLIIVGTRPESYVCQLSLINVDNTLMWY